jgi:alanyl-tRNA synthetase
VECCWQVIGDHIRAVVYLISDGVNPSNIGRGYIVRRLIRRVVRMGRLLGIHGDGKGDLGGAFLPVVAEVAVAMSGDVDPDVATRASKIYEELQREELRFVQTLEKGEKLLEELLNAALENGASSTPYLSGKDIFKLYDTFGFPVEITEEVAAERGVGVDLTAFEAEMDIQRKQSQAAHNVIKLTVGGVAADALATVPETQFVGYDELLTSSSVLGILSNGVSLSESTEGEEDIEILLDRTPFYAESGGQIGDHGLLSVKGAGEKGAVVEVIDVVKEAGRFRHRCKVREGKVTVGLSMDAEVDSNLRKRAQAHHTATHLLQAALKKVLGADTSQAGSLVAFDRLRFDFNLPRAMTEAEVTQVESLVNDWIGMGVSLTSEEMALVAAKEKGAIAMFGEKYGEQVSLLGFFY